MSELLPFDAQKIEESLGQTGEPIADTAFLRSSTDSVPLIVYTDRQQRHGADLVNMYTTHIITIDRYSLDGVPNSKIQKMLDLAGIDYEYVKYYIMGDEIMQETYTLDPIIIRD